MSDPLTALKARQGAGARYDAEGAPADDLLLVRRGTAFFARKLAELSDAQLTPERRRIIAQISYDARALAEVLAAARSSQPAVRTSINATPDEISHGTSLPARALRHLFHHTEVHLNVEWRDLPSGAWDQPLQVGGTARDTPLRRARSLWQAALDLRNGTRPCDVPSELYQGQE